MLNLLLGYTPHLMFPKPKLIYRIFAVPFILLGAIVLYIGGANLVRGLSSQNWPQTDGVITAASIKKQFVNADSPDTYTARISYDYKVAGVAYTSARICFGGPWGSSDKADAQSIVSHFQPGMTVSVFYSPQDPGSAVLERGINGTWRFFCFGVAFLFAGFWLFTKRNPTL